MTLQNVLIAFLLVASAWLGWTVLNLAVENDGLRQVIAGHKESVESLLDYAAIATRCDVSPEELARALDASIYGPPDGAQKKVARLAFQAKFDERGLVEVGVVDVNTVAVCRPR